MHVERRLTRTRLRSGGVRWVIASALTMMTVLALAAIYSSSAQADADPASDVLLAQNAFYPYQLPNDPPLEAAMNKVLDSSARAGLPLKVAVIGSRLDLGAVPNLFGHPQQYAQFLDKEISYNNRPPLLVVMPAGFGVVAAGPPNALKGLKVDTQHGPYGLVRTALLAVAVVVHSTGRTIATPSIPSSSSSGGGPPAIVLFALPVTVLVLGGFLVRRRERSRHQQSRASVSHERSRSEERVGPPPAIAARRRAAERARRRRRRRVLAACGLLALVLIVAAAVDLASAHHRAARSATAPANAVEISGALHRGADGQLVFSPTQQLQLNDRILAYTSYVSLGSPRRREVALTFDDGPSPWTPKILAVLRREHAVATFFEIGRNVLAYPRYTAELTRAGMIIGDHTETHRPLAELSAARQADEIYNAAAAIRDAGAPAPLLFRPPYGSFNKETLALLRRRHMMMVLWSADTSDYLQPGVAKIRYTAISGARPGAIILFHDGGGPRSQTLAALPRVIRRLRARGFRLVTIWQLLHDDPPPAGQAPPRNLSGG
jgi:peptidoglycan-N-acetylglucosamine deacetylase